jgi:hypothetical protein
MVRRLDLGTNRSLRKESKAEKGRGVHLRCLIACRFQVQGGRDSVYFVPQDMSTKYHLVTSLVTKGHPSLPESSEHVSADWGTSVNVLLVYLGSSRGFVCVKSRSDLTLTAIVSISDAVLVFSHVISVGRVRLKRVRCESLHARRWGTGRFGRAVNYRALTFSVVSSISSFFTIILKAAAVSRELRGVEPYFDSQLLHQRKEEMYCACIINQTDLKINCHFRNIHEAKIDARRWAKKTHHTSPDPVQLSRRWTMPGSA